MKMKWKIMLNLFLFVAALTVITNIYYYNTIKKLINQDTENKLESYTSLGLTLLDDRYPGDWSLDGDKLYKGNTLINKNYNFIDGFANDTKTLVTLFANDTRIATNVKDKNGNRSIGTKASAAVIKEVLKSKSKYKGTADVAGSAADTYYVPLYDKSGKVVGMWFVGIYSKVANDKILNAVNSSIPIIILFLGIGLAFSYFLGSYISKSIKVIKENIKQMEHGNFKINFKMKHNNRKDEIGDISRSFINMQNRISEIINSIKAETVNIDTLSAILAEGADNVYQHVQEISATTEQLTSGMEETSASAEEMNATASEIDKEVINVASKVKQGQTVTGEIKNRAENLREEAIDSRKTATEMYNSANKKLRSSIDKANSIDQIKALSQTILEITSQTNLLALNATIEAARAGEAGKGFSVVANEISILAENSKKAVSKIEEISNDVGSAVEEMISSSKNLLAFVDQKVVKDYDVLVKTGEQYNEDAHTVETMVTEIEKSTSQLSESIQYIIQAIEAITTATTEGTAGSADIAEKSNAILQKTNQVLEQANSNKKIADRLKDMVQFFQI